MEALAEARALNGVDTVKRDNDGYSKIVLNFEEYGQKANAIRLPFQSFSSYRGIGAGFSNSAIEPMGLFESIPHQTDTTLKDNIRHLMGLINHHKPYGSLPLPMALPLKTSMCSFNLE